jgi:hypothetical protein
MPVQKTRNVNGDELVPTKADHTKAASSVIEANELHEVAEGRTNVQKDDDNAVNDTQSDLPDNSPKGILLRKGDGFSIHPAAKRFRKLKPHRERLRKSLEEHGQREDAIARLLPDGTLEILDGVTRLEELFAMQTPLRCRLLNKSELEGGTIEDWIMKVNLHNGRDLNDAQRTVAAMDVFADQIDKWIVEARERQNTGKAVGPKDKFDIAECLAERVNVSKNKMEKTLQLRKLPSGSELLQALWEGIPVSTALKIAHEKDDEKRNLLVSIASKGDKERLKIAMTESTAKRASDRFGVSIPPSLLDTFEQTTAAETAISQAEHAAESLRGTSPSSKFIDDALRLRTDILPKLAYAMCDWCEWSGRVDDTACPTCKGKRYLTLAEFEEAKGREKKKLVVITK